MCLKVPKQTTCRRFTTSIPTYIRLSTRYQLALEAPSQTANTCIKNIPKLPTDIINIVNIPNVCRNYNVSKVIINYSEQIRQAIEFQINVTRMDNDKQITILRTPMCIVCGNSVKQTSFTHSLVHDAPY